MAYPVAYRTNKGRTNSRPVGFQRPTRDTRPTAPIRLPRPANDNPRPRPGFGRRPPGPPGGGVGGGPIRVPRGVLGGLGRMAGRLVPLIGWGMVGYELYRWYTDKPAGWPSPEGWVLDFECNKPLNYCQKWRSVTGGWNSCLTTQAAVANCDDYINPAYDVMLRLHRTSSSLVWRWNVEARWHRITPGMPFDTDISKQEVPLVMPMVVPAPLPVPAALDAAVLPILQPAPTPRPIPWTVLPHVQPNPWRDPVEQSTRGYAVGVDAPVDYVSPVVPYHPLVPVSPGFATPVRAIVADYSAGRAPKLDIVRGGGDSRTRDELARPPAPREKERKLRIRGRALGAVWFAIGQVTETMDLVGALYKSLPKDIRWQIRKETWKSKTRLDGVYKAKMVYKYFDKIPLDDFILNYVDMQIGDFVAALPGKGYAKASQALHKRTGVDARFQLGPLDTLFADMESDVRAHIERAKGEGE